jgi:hypothetical protein
MKACIDFTDGRFTLESYSAQHARKKRATLEVNFHLWQLYQKHLETDRHWQQFIAQLDNDAIEAYEKEDAITGS